ncbi:MAG: alpha-mannosidase [Actinomycetota bacterium]
MHSDAHLVLRRIDRALRDRLRPAVVVEEAPLSVASWQAPGRESRVAEARAARFAPHRPGEAWGPAWATTWFRCEGRLPAHWAGGRVEARVDLGFDAGQPGFQAEGLAYRLDGTPIKGIAPRNDHLPLAAIADADGAVAFLVEAAANPEILAVEPDGTDFRWQILPRLLGDERTAGHEPLYRLGPVRLVLLDDEVGALLADVEALRELLVAVPEREPRHHEVLRGLEDAIDLVDRDGPAAAAGAARHRLAPLLAAPASASAHTVYAVGHAHLDSAWLWPLAESVRKAARTFANVTELAEAYPDLVFAGSQPQQYAWVKARYPAIYARLREAVAAGRWAPVGAMWVEADANLPGGEAMARQFVCGQRFLREELGVESEVAWLPDSFGYSAALPQIAALAGARWFLTQKLSWNDTNRFPHHTFWWEGIDGTRVFTHFPPVDTYNAELTGAELAHVVDGFAEKGRARRSLAPFGYGDGGGGPTREMLERARRFADLEGLPRVVLAGPERFFAEAEAEYPDAPVWRGELTLEAHRGTFTTQARTKAGNRASEGLLREAELWAASATLYTGAAYPADELDARWKEVLLHQFHDILPGSSISQVHREAVAAYGRIAGALEGLIADALAALAPADGVVANPAGHDRREVVAAAAPPPQGGPTQRLGDGRVAFVAAAPGGGLGALEALAPEAEVVVDETSLDNGLLRVELDDDGLISRLHDRRAGREVVPPGRPAGLLRLHPDHPARWDAWDLDRSYRHSAERLTAVETREVAEAGPLLGVLRLVRRCGRSTVTQEVRLAAGSDRVDLVTDVDWAEDERLLKLELPLAVHPDRARAEIQFGHVARPVGSSTSWQEARYETYGHRWLHVGEAGYGVAVVNATAYGHDVAAEDDADGARITTVGMSLLRAPRFPDPEADRGRHRVVVGVVPGADVAAAARHGLALNLPLRVRPAAGPADAAARPAAAGAPGACGLPAPLVGAAGEGVEVDAVKLAEDGSGDLVVRLHERLGGRRRSVLRLGVAVEAATACDLLERPRATLAVRDDDEVDLELRPFEILTVRCALRGR